MISATRTEACVNNNTKQKENTAREWVCVCAHSFSVRSGLTKLGVDAVTLDYPLGPGHGYSNRVLRLSRASSQEYKFLLV